MVRDLDKQDNCCIIIILLICCSKLYRYEATNYDKIICLALNIVDKTIIRKKGNFPQISIKPDGSGTRIS